jgi:hypothetical protein
MRHLVNDVKYVRQHIAKLFELLRQVSADVCDAFLLSDAPAPAAGVADGAGAAFASGDSGYGGYSGAGVAEPGYSDHASSNHGRDARSAPLGSEARFDEQHHANNVRFFHLCDLPIACACC